MGGSAATAAAITTGATATGALAGAGVGVAVSRKISDMSIEEVEKEIKKIPKNDRSKRKRLLKLINHALKHYRKENNDEKVNYYTNLADKVNGEFEFKL